MKEAPSSPLMKSIWFEFAVSYSNTKNINYFSQKSVKMLTILMQNYNLRTIYTHHPAILHWTFSDFNINKDLKQKVMHLWLENIDKASQDELLHVLVTRKDASFIFLELLTSTTSGNLVKNVLSLLVTHLHTMGNSQLIGKLIEEVWDILPHILATFSPISHLNTLENLTPAFILCIESKPINMNKAILLRIACLLPDIIASYYKRPKSLSTDRSNVICETLTYSFQFASIVVEQAVLYGDKRILMTFLHHEQFLTTLESCFNTDDIYLGTAILSLLGNMLQFQLQCQIESAKMIQLPSEKFINMMCNDIQTARAGLKLLVSFLEGYVTPKIPLFINIAPPSAKELRALYIQIHMICAQGSDEVCCWSWICLKHLLSLSNQMKLQFHLATLPFTQKLILACPPQSNAWSHMLAFLPTWLSSLPPINRRAFTFSNVQRTFSKLANILQSQKETLNDPRLQCILLKVLNSGAIPGYLTTALKEKMTTIDKS